MAEKSSKEQELAFKMEAKVQVYLLYQMAQIIDLGMSRGAFRGPEASQVGAIFDKLSGAVNSALEQAKKIVETTEETAEETTEETAEETTEETAEEIEKPVESPPVPVASE